MSQQEKKQTSEEFLLRMQCDRDASNGILNFLFKDNIQLNSNLLFSERTISNLNIQLEKLKEEINKIYQLLEQRESDLQNANEILNTLKQSESQQKNDVINLPKRQRDRKKKIS